MKIIFPSIRDILNGSLPFRLSRAHSSDMPESFDLYGDTAEAPRADDPHQEWKKEQRAQMEKIRFDNSIRFLIGLLCYGGSMLLWACGYGLNPFALTTVTAVYFLTLYIGALVVMNSSFSRETDIAFCLMDVVGTSVAVSLTGGINSPLYFLYFVPLIVHSFHRDWLLILISGIGGGMLYATAITLSSWNTPARLSELGVRLIMMMLTIGVASMSLFWLKKQEIGEERRVQRLKAMNNIDGILNKLTSLHDVAKALDRLTHWINEGIGLPLQPWTHIALKPLTREETTPLEKEAGDAFVSSARLIIQGSTNEQYGRLLVGSLKPDGLQRDERDFLAFVARSIGLAVERIIHMSELHKALEINSCVMASFIASTQSVRNTLRVMMESITHLIPTEQVSVMLWEEDLHGLRTVDVAGPHAIMEWDYNVRSGEGIAGNVFKKGETFCDVINPQEVFGAEHLLARAVCLCVPITTLHHGSIGVMTLHRFDTGEEFSRSEIECAQTYAARAAVALENAKGHESQRLALRKQAAPPLFKAA